MSLAFKGKLKNKKYLLKFIYLIGNEIIGDLL